MRTAEVGNWTGLALVCPRTDLARLGARSEVRFTTAGGDDGRVLPTSELRLELKWEDARAECKVLDGQFVVQAGSTARSVEVDSLGAWLRTLRGTLKENGVLVATGSGLLKFTQAYAFESPSAAAGVVSGTGLNGRAAWKVKGSGEPYKDWLESQVSNSPNIAGR
jgi:hypothetical protein